MSKDKNSANLFLETLDWICNKLGSLDMPYMITGGAAVGFWGHIRTTMDIDILIQISSNKINLFLKSIENESYVDAEEAKKAILDKSMFNIIFNKSGFKIDIIPLDITDTYESEKFSRRIKIKFYNKEIFIIGPEDLIISKIIWSKSAGGSERQLSDCESIWRLNKENIDLDYIKRWIKVLKVEEEFDKLIRT